MASLSPPTPPLPRVADAYDAMVDQIGFVVHRAPNPAWRHTPPPDNRWWVLAVAESGLAHYRINGAATDVQAGQMLLFPPGIDRHGQSDPSRPWAYFSAAFDLRGSRDAIQALAALPRVVQPDAVQECVSLFRQLQHGWLERRPGFLMHCRGLIQQLLAILIRSTQSKLPDVPHAARIAAIMKAIQRDDRRHYSVEELADLAGLSVSRFRLLFKQVAGQSAIQYQNSLRMHRARNLLLSGNCTVTEAAELTGFRDVYYFSRLFKRMTGVNPSTLRLR